MDENKSTTPGDNPNDDTTAGGTTVTDPTQTGTDNQPGSDANNLDDSSKSTDGNAADDDKKSTDDTKKTDDTPASTQLDDDLDDWIEKRGLPKPADDAQKQKYQDLRNEQREYTRSQQAKREAADAQNLSSEIKNSKPTVNEEDDERTDEEKRLDKIEADLAEERTTRAQSEFYTDNKVTEEEHKAILDIYKERVNSPASEEGKLRAFDYWSSPDALPDLLALARAKLASNTDTSVIEDEAARKERERIARESNAKSPSGAAKTTQTGGNEDINSDEARRKRFEARYGK